MSDGVNWLNRNKVQIYFYVFVMDGLYVSDYFCYQKKITKAILRMFLINSKGSCPQTRQLISSHVISPVLEDTIICWRGLSCYTNIYVIVQKGLTLVCVTVEGREQSNA